MVPVKHIIVLALLVLLVPAKSSSRSGPERSAATPGSLFAQASAEALNHDFPNPDVSFLLVDARTGQVLASRWENIDAPVPVGSLAKPFAALAYGDRHSHHYPEHICRGSRSGCWRPGGHGEIDLTSAIAYSCNSYFRVLTQDLRGVDLSETAKRFGIEAPDPQATGMDLAGLGPRWKISPLRMAHAYLELLGNHEDPTVAQILAGMERSAHRGTGLEVDRVLQPQNALVKTGTATCTHLPHAPGDGFAMVLAPAEGPRLLLMVRVHGVPGSQAAKTAGQMLRRIAE